MGRRLEQAEPYRAAIRTAFPALSTDVIEKLACFAGILQEVNQRQNLTRMDSPEDFVLGHLTDCVQLVEAGFIQGKCLDLGSGQGIPGLVCEILTGQAWVVAESERRKGEFLSLVKERLGLWSEVFVGRGEALLTKTQVDRVVCRAVGPVSRIFGWLSTCSTWNTLVLLKSRGWELEWSSFGRGKFRGKLTVKRTHEYTVGPENKYRLIIELQRTNQAHGRRIIRG